MNLYRYVLNNPVRYRDPWGLWNEDVHSGIGNPNYGTYLWARQAGLTDLQARMIAVGNNAVDDYFGWLIGAGVPGRHFDTSIGAVDSRDLFANYDLELATRLYKEGTECAALKTLGRGLHSIQDKIGVAGDVHKIIN